MKVLIILVFVLVTVYGNVLDDYRHHIKEESKKMWHTMDHNHNKHLDKDDFKIMIHFYDTDGNTNVTESEFVFHFDIDAPTLAISADGLFHEFDDNNNGVYEESDIDGVYKRMDINKDGTVDHHEFTTYFEEVLTILYMIQIQQIVPLPTSGPSTQMPMSTSM